jgi:hypothetical protein
VSSHFVTNSWEVRPVVLLIIFSSLGFWKWQKSYGYVNLWLLKVILDFPSGLPSGYPRELCADPKCLFLKGLTASVFHMWWNVYDGSDACSRIATFPRDSRSIPAWIDTISGKYKENLPGIAQNNLLGRLHSLQFTKLNTWSSWSVRIRTGNEQVVTDCVRKILWRLPVRNVQLQRRIRLWLAANHDRTLPGLISGDCLWQIRFKLTLWHPFLRWNIRDCGQWWLMKPPKRYWFIRRRV